MESTLWLHHACDGGGDRAAMKEAQIWAQWQKALPWAKSPAQASFLSILFIIAAGFLKSMNKQTWQRLSPGGLEKDLVAPITRRAAVGRGWTEGSSVQARQPFARAASGCRSTGQVPSAVKGNISANVGTRDGVDLVSFPKGHQVALKRREKRGTSLLSGIEWRDKLGNSGLTTPCEFWLQVQGVWIQALVPWCLQHTACTGWEHGFHGFWWDVCSIFLDALVHLTMDSVSTSTLYSPHGSSILTLSSSPGNVVLIRACRM